VASGRTLPLTQGGRLTQGGGGEHYIKKKKKKKKKKQQQQQPQVEPLLPLATILGG
jgi:hypothetical protein